MSVKVRIEEGQEIVLNIGLVKLIVKNNGEGVEIEKYAKYPLDDIQFGDEQIYFDEVNKMIENDANQVD